MHGKKFAACELRRVEESECRVLAAVCGGESEILCVRFYGVFALSLCVESGENGGVVERQVFVTSAERIVL